MTSWANNPGILRPQNDVFETPASKDMLDWNLYFTGSFQLVTYVVMSEQFCSFSAVGGASHFIIGDGDDAIVTTLSGLSIVCLFETFIV